MFSCTKGSKFSFAMFKIANKHPQNTESKFYNLIFKPWSFSRLWFNRVLEALRQLRPTLYKYWLLMREMVVKLFQVLGDRSTIFPRAEGPRENSSGLQSTDGAIDLTILWILSSQYLFYTMISPAFFSCHVIVKTNTWLKSLQSWYNAYYSTQLPAVALVSHKQGKLKYAAFCLKRLLGTHGGCISTTLTKGCEPTLKW